MQIEAGKRYVRRDGVVTEPANPQPHSAQWPWHIPMSGSYTDTGRFNGAIDDHMDLISEAFGAQPGPSPTNDYQRGWDDCLEAVHRILGEKFPRPVN